MDVFQVFSRKRITLTPDLLLARGGEGKVYAIPDNESFVLKIYNQPTEKHARKLTAMVIRPPDDPMESEGCASMAWPMDLLRACNGSRDIVGFVMPRIKQSSSIICCYNPRLRRTEFPSFTYRDLHRVAHRIAAIVHSIHTQGYVIGDINEGNILANQAAQVTFVDVDSFQISDPFTGQLYRSSLCKSEFTPPELQGKALSKIDRQPEHDLFGLGILIFELLMEGIHPFWGLFTGEGEPPSVEERISGGYFPYGRKLCTSVQPAPSYLPFEVLHPSLQELFICCFEEGHRNPLARPHAKEWEKTLGKVEKGLIHCSTNDNHQYGCHLNTCPWCERTEQFGGYDAFPSKEARQRQKPVQDVVNKTHIVRPNMQLYPPESLVDYLKADKCVLFVGSGLSAWANLPTWKQLLRTLVDRLSNEKPRLEASAQLNNLIDTGKLLEVGEYCRRELGSSLFCQILSEQMRRDNTVIPELHKMLMSLSFSAIVTTNYDKLLEQAYYSTMNGVIPRTATHKDTASLGTLLFDRRFFILKAHGDIDQPDSLVFTSSDYRELIHSNQAYNTMFSALLLTKAIVFVGYSISDPDFRLLLDYQFTTFKGSIPARFALMSEVSDVEQSVLWDTAQIQVLSYSDHKEILTFFQRVQELTASPLK